MRDEQRRRVAIACRILAHAGLIEDVLGHVSVRLDDDTFLVRARGPREAGVLFTEPADVVACSLATGAPLEDTGWSLPNELPIHLACYRDDPSVRAVVHAHPPAVVAADLAGVPLVPMIGAYNIPAARLAAEGIPVFQRAVLINTDELGGGDARERWVTARCACSAATASRRPGATLAQAVALALAVDSLARMACRVAAAGGDAGGDRRRRPRPAARSRPRVQRRHDVAPPRAAAARRRPRPSRGAST